MRKLLSTAAVAGFLFWVTAPAVATATAVPSESDRLPFTPVPATQVWATRQASAQPGQQAPQFLRLEVATLSQRVVLSDSAPTVTITGKVVNIGDRKIDNVVLRLERGQALTSEEDVRNALREPASAEFVQPRFTEIAQVLQAGETKDFSLEVPLRGPDSTTLAIEEPGIYPILANVNGKPDFGGQARLAALSTLLPVLGVPGAASKERPAAPPKVTMLWPMADRPRLVHSAGPGDSVLVDDELTGSLSVGGRLYSLLQAYESAVPTMSTSLCLAVDPDLLRTVEAMSTGYEVRGGATGKGKEEAALWLDRLRLAVAGRCVVALPYADADLVALSRGKLTDLASIALESADVIRDVLKVQPLPNLAWPEDGVLDQQTFDALVGKGVKTLIMDPSGISDAPGTGPVLLPGDQKVAVTRLDTMVSDALHAGVDRSRSLGGVATPVENQPVSVQNALAALVFRAGFQGEGRNVVIAPPRRWNAPVTEMNEFLNTLQKLLGGGYAVQAGLGELFSTATPAPGKVSYPVEAGAREISPSVVSSVARQWGTIQGVFEEMAQADSGSAEPKDLVEPLRLGLLRAMSGAWRSNEAGARSAAELSAAELRDLQEQVTITPPNSPILLGSGDSPIPVTLTNKLDVRINVRIVVADTPGIRPRELADQVLPARGERLVRVPVDVLRSGRFSVNVRLTTPDGVALGDTVKLEVSSSAYGTITVVITATAAIALVLLSGRRIYRRVRTAREAAAEAPQIENVTPEKSGTS